jgi:hypothetical protein
MIIEAATQTANRTGSVKFFMIFLLVSMTTVLTDEEKERKKKDGHPACIRGGLEGFYKGCGSVRNLVLFSRFNAFMGLQ